MEKRNHTIVWCFLYMFLSSKMAAAQIIPVKVGVVLNMNEYGAMTSTCLSMALSDFYATHPHYKTRIHFITRHSKGDTVGAAAAAGLDLVKNVEVQAILGPTFSVQALFLISLGDKAQVPIISFTATSPSLSSLRSPYFVRATLSDASQVDAIGAIVEAFGWREVVPVYEDSEFGEGIIPYLTNALERVDARIPYRSVIPPLATDDQLKMELYKLMTMQTRVFIVHMMGSLASRFFTKAHQIGLMSRGCVWIVTNGITNEFYSLDPSVLVSMQGVLGVRHHVPRTKELRAFEIRFKKQVGNSGSKVVAADLDIFGLWAYDSAVVLAIAAEKAGLTNNTLKYRHRNMTLNKTSTDLEDFGVSDAGPKLIQALSNTTFKGLAGEFHLVDGQLQAPPLEFVNFIGHELRSIGYWTKENGIVKELNSKSSDLTITDTTSKSKLGSIIWPGHTSSSPKGWEIPTNGKKLRVGVPIKDGFSEFVRITWNPKNNSTKVEGYCIEVFEAVMAALPYGVPYEYIPFANPDRSMAGNYNDLIYQVYLGKYDIVAGDVTIVANRSQYVDFSLPYTESGVAMVVPFRDTKNKNTWVFMKPLTLELWATSLCSFIFFGLFIWILEGGICNDLTGTRLENSWIVIRCTFSTMVSAHEKAKSSLSRVVLITWFLGAIILIQSYTASLSSMLTVQKLQPTVTDVQDLIRNKEINVGYMKGSFVLGLLKGMDFDESRLVEYDSEKKLDELLSRGSGKGGIAAAFHEILYIQLFLGKYCSKYTMIGPINKADGFGIVFPIGSPLVNDVSRAILNVMESQKVADIETKWFGDMNKCSALNEMTVPQNLGLSSFEGIFLIFGVVGFATLIAYGIGLTGAWWSSLILRLLPQHGAR